MKRNENRTPIDRAHDIMPRDAFVYGETETPANKAVSFFADRAPSGRKNRAPSKTTRARLNCPHQSHAGRSFTRQTTGPFHGNTDHAAADGQGRGGGVKRATRRLFGDGAAGSGRSRTERIAPAHP